jgi:hypothetical protein
MKKTTFYILITAIILLVGCASVQKPAEQPRIASTSKPPTEIPITVPTKPPATYENDVYPFIIEQLNNTAETFFYDLVSWNRKLRERRLPTVAGPAGNFIVGKNETGGVCQDYASHFIDNYKGLGDVYFLSVDDKGTAFLHKRLKQFERKDIIISDTKTINSYIDEIYQWVINQAKQENSRFIWQNDQWSTFYTYTNRGTVYWSETTFNSDTPLVPFVKGHIKINMANYQAERNKQKEKLIDDIYNTIIKNNNANNEFTNWGQSFESPGWNIPPLKFHTNRDKKLFLMEETSIPTPAFHAGTTEKEKIFNHAWVRILWNGMTVDIEPTWYDNGVPVEWGIVEEIFPNNVTTYPYAFLKYNELPATRLIAPITGTLKPGTSQTFVISSKDYSEFSIIINNEWHYFTKSETTENYELTLTIPQRIDAIDIYGVTVSGTQRNGIGLIRYKVE